MIDPHFHSTYSDGQLAVSEIADQLIKSNIQYCALTDHNTVDGLKEMKNALAQTSVNFISGVEMTALYNDHEIHTLVYDFDIDQAVDILKERNEIVNKLKIEELRAATQLFKKEGFAVSDNLEPIGRCPAGLIIALDVYNNKENQELMIKKHGHLLTREEFFYTYQEVNCPCRAPLAGVSMEWIIEKFKPLTKNIMIAHPFVATSVTIKPLIEENIIELVAMGVTGVEVYHNQTSVEKIKFFEKFVADNDLFYSGGSDSHFKENKNTLLGYYNDQDLIPGFKLNDLSFSINKP
jgi:3',5'-nucleoside bisphosphate phosphatase